MIRTLPVLALAACGGSGTWTMTTWGEAFIEEGMGPEVFADGCEAHFDRFLVVVSGRALVDDAGRVVAEIPGTHAYDLVRAGPHVMGAVEAPAGTWRGMTATLAPDPDALAGAASDDDLALLADRGASIVVQGTLTCAETSVGLDWSFATATDYACDPENLVIASGGEAATELTIHGDHLFYDSLVDPDAQVRGQAILDLDVGGDGVVDDADLAAGLVAPTGYTVGAFSDATDFGAYLAHATASVGHVDGEGHCAVTSR